MQSGKERPADNTQNVNVIELPDNLISLKDQETLESFGGHEVSLGRATRFHWGENDNGDPVFEVYRGGANEEFVLSISRDREKDLFEAIDENGVGIVSGSLDHVMAVLDRRFIQDHEKHTSS